MPVTAQKPKTRAERLAELHTIYGKPSARETALAEKARRNLAAFAMQAWHVLEPSTPYVHGWHIDAISEHLMAVTDGQIKNLLINIPPRHMKSILATVAWFAWSWIEKPHLRWMFASYALSLSIRDSRKCRQIIESPWYQRNFGDSFALASDQNAKQRFENDHRGYRLAVSTDSAATGEGGDLVVCLCYHTQVTTDAGRLPIGDIVERRLPVRVLAFDHTSNTPRWQRIETYELSKGRASVRVTFSDGRSIDATTDHPLYVVDKGYIPAAQLNDGDEVVTDESSLPQLQQKTVETLLVRCVEPIPTPERVYNVRVAQDHNYFANGVLVHNCDDPHNVREMESTLKRQTVLDWWDQTMSTRLNNPKTGAKVVIMQRLREKDLSGHLLEQGGYVHFCLPAEYELSRTCFTSIGWSDPRKEEGELLWPQRMGPDEIAKAKRTLGPLGYAGQYQQRPAPAGGAIFKQEWLRRYSLTNNGYVTLHTPDGDKHWPLKDCRRIATVDVASRKTETADYTVIATWLITPDGELVLRDLVRERMTSPEQQKAIKAAHTQWRYEAIHIESVAYQLALVQQLLPQGIPAMPFNPNGGDKVARATTAAIFYAAGMVYHPLASAWLGEFEEELLLFPKAEHDDMVDVVSMACALLFVGGDIPMASSAGGPVPGETPLAYRTSEDEEENARLQEQQSRIAGVLGSLRSGRVGWGIPPQGQGGQR